MTIIANMRAYLVWFSFAAYTWLTLDERTDAMEFGTATVADNPCEIQTKRKAQFLSAFGTRKIHSEC